MLIHISGGRDKLRAVETVIVRRARSNIAFVHLIVTDYNDEWPRKSVIGSGKSLLRLPFSGIANTCRLNYHLLCLLTRERPGVNEISLLSVYSYFGFVCP